MLDSLRSYVREFRPRMLAKSGLGPNNLFVLQPTPYCNLACKYCYLPDKDNRERMSEETLFEILRFGKTAGFWGPPFTILWHAGEPLVLGVGWYEKSFGIISSELKGYRYTHSFQTNGTLINQQWCDFFKKHPNVRIGVSLDGPQIYHDKNRVSRTGTGSYSRVINGIELLNENEIPFSVICVLTADSIREPDKMFDFFRDNAIHNIGFNIDEEEGDHKKSSLRGLQEHEFSFFLRRFFERAQRECPQMNVRELTEATKYLLSSQIPEGNSDLVTPFVITTFSYKGEISTFSPELIGQKSSDYGDFVIGNVYQDSFSDLLKKPIFLRLQKEILTGVKNCKESCGFFKTCRGGAPANKFYENGSFESTRTLNCQLHHQTVVQVVGQMLNDDLINVRTIFREELSGERVSNQA